MRCLPHGIFQASAKEAEAADYAALGIRGIINVSSGETLVYHQGASLLCIRVDDFEPVRVEDFETAVNFYDRHKPVIVHCQMGASRSRVFAAALLVAAGVKLEEAIRLAEPPLLTRPFLSFKKWAEGLRVKS